MSFDCVVVIPVLNRPERVEPMLWTLENGRGERPYRGMFVVSPNDDDEIRALRRHGADFLVSPWPAPASGDWARKINYAVGETNEPWIFTGADDLCFCPQWLDRAFECAEATSASVIGTNDLSSPRVLAGQHSCHPLVSRAYVQEHGTIDESGKMLHEGYDHNYPDDELVGTARARGQWVFCASSHVEHLHPSWGKGVDDETYRKGQLRFHEDRRLFERRRQLWTGA